MFRGHLTWTVLITSLLIILIFPARRRVSRSARPPLRCRGSIPPTVGRSWQAPLLVLWAPEVYVIALPFFGIVSEILPVFSRQADLRLPDPGLRDDRDRRVVGQRLGAPHVCDRANPAAVLRGDDDAHRGADRREVLQLDRHPVGRPPAFSTPMIWAMGFLVTFLFGGTGVILASPLDFRLSDSTSWWPTSTTSSSGPSCSRCSRLLFLVAEVRRRMLQ